MENLVPTPDQAVSTATSLLYRQYVTAIVNYLTSNAPCLSPVIDGGARLAFALRVPVYSWRHPSVDEIALAMLEFEQQGWIVKRYTCLDQGMHSPTLYSAKKPTDPINEHDALAFFTPEESELYEQLRQQALAQKRSLLRYRFWQGIVSVCKSMRRSGRTAS